MSFRALLIRFAAVSLIISALAQADEIQLDSILESDRTGVRLSCQSCHADQRVLTGGTAGLGSRRANSLWLATEIDRASEHAILDLADPDDADEDGISGRVSWVLSLSEQRPAPGRFGWKASVASLEDQIANALITDMELENALLRFAHPTCSVADLRCVVTAEGDPFERPLIDPIAEALRATVKQVSISAQEVPQTFYDLGCATCHVPSLQGKDGDEVWLFSDLLLHDMGSFLSEPMRVGAARPFEWKTAPLRGLSERKRFLHDGRTTSLSAAIAAHGGEAALSAKAFLALERQHQLDFLNFLNSL